MPDIPMMMGGGVSVTYGYDADGPGGVNVPAAGTNNTKGDYIEIVAATTYEADSMAVHLWAPSNVQYLVDIAVGASTAEKDIVSNILFSGKASESGMVINFEPLHIPKGSRISARCQATIASSSLEAAVTLCSRGAQGMTGMSRITTYGADTSDSGGFGYDPGGVANTLGGWTELTSATTNAIKRIVIVLGDRANNAMTNAAYHNYVGIGGAGAEKILFVCPFAAGSTSDSIEPLVFGPYSVNIPKGTRLAINGLSNITDATDRLWDVVIYGID